VSGHVVGVAGFDGVAAWWQSLTCLVRYATRTVLSGEVSELIELAKTNLRELAVE
jgi:hypothetical protein